MLYEPLSIHLVTMIFNRSKTQKIAMACIMLVVNLSIVGLENTNSSLSLIGENSAEVDAALSIFNAILAMSSIIVIVNELRLMRSKRGRSDSLEAPESETLTDITTSSTSATLSRYSDKWRMYRKDSQMSCQ